MIQTRPWLLPLSWPYAAVVWLRNKLYSTGILKSVAPSGKTVVIGNLSLGGTGKTPQTDYIVGLLGAERCALLSRGYGRTSSGFMKITPDAHPDDAGDEALMLVRRHPALAAAVCENRTEGLERLAADFPEREVTVLDDALQHRRIRGGLNVLLTTWHRPFTRDYCLPAGSLRDHKVRARYADCVVVTKTPRSADEEARDRLRKELGYLGVPVFFSHTVPGRFMQLGASRITPISELRHVLLISAVAEPEIFEAEARRDLSVAGHFAYRDHHRFTAADLQRIRNFIGKFAHGSSGVVTTEKDAVRLLPFSAEFEKDKIPVYYREINTDFGKDAKNFNELILKYAQS